MFTDDDLKQLKDSLHKQDDGCSEYCIPPCSELEALIARLEACERALKGFVDLEADKMNYDTVVSLLNEWRKAAGK